MFVICVKSFIREKNEMIPVEVELSLWPGLPSIQFLGLPDQHVKESAARIKSAIRASGFEFPVAQQILVNLRPSHLKKTSRGLDLAVAVAFLWESEQVSRPLESKDYFVYGELSLSGLVIEPEDIYDLESSEALVILTGSPEAPSSNYKGFKFRRKRIEALSEIGHPQEVLPDNQNPKKIRPSLFKDFLFSQEQANILKLVGLGEHSILLAGAAGSGKSTVAAALGEVLVEPDPGEFQETQKVHKKYGQSLDWRPIVKPHHTTSVIAMVGGGSIPFAGEISRAHGGVLILDELLEYSPKVQEALREPFEDGKMRVFRNGQLREYPAKALIVGTTNLCPCGKWTPRNHRKYFCQWSRQKCEGYRQKLSGPLLDRFEILYYMDKAAQSVVTRQEIIDHIEQAQMFNQKNHISVEWSRVEANLSPDLKIILQEDRLRSQRRKRAILRVARSLASLDQSLIIQLKHLQNALEICLESFENLQSKTS